MKMRTECFGVDCSVKCDPHLRLLASGKRVSDSLAWLVFMVSTKMNLKWVLVFKLNEEMEEAFAL